MIECRMESGFAIIRTFTWRFKIKNSSRLRHGVPVEAES